MASLEERFIAARNDMERCVEEAGERNPEIKAEVEDQLDRADVALDAIQDALSEIGDAAETAGAAVGEAEHEHGTE